MRGPTTHRRRRYLSPALTIAMCAAVLVASPLPAAADSRISGATRYETAVAVSQAFVDPDGIDQAILASGANFPDALVAGPVAATLGIPILLTDPTALPAVTAEELRRLDVDTVHVFGGTAAITDAVTTELADIVPTVRRWAGPDRYATAAAVVDAFFPDPVRRVVVATGRDFHDPLAAAAFGARGWVDEEDGVHQRIPLLITSGTGPLEDPIRATIERLAPGQIIVAGPPDAIGEEAREELRRLASGRDEHGEFLPPPRFLELDPTVDGATVGGVGADAASMLATHTAEARPLDRLLLVTGATFADALAATPVAGLDGGGAVLYADRDCIPAASRHTMAVVRASEDTDVPPPDVESIVVGGTAALSEDVASELPCLPEVDLTGAWTPITVDMTHVEGFPSEPLSVATVGPVGLAALADGSMQVVATDPPCDGVTDVGTLHPLADLYGGIWLGRLALTGSDCGAVPGPGVAMYDPATHALALCSWPEVDVPRCEAYHRADPARDLPVGQGHRGGGLSPAWNLVAQIEASRRAALGAFKLCTPLHSRARTIADVRLWVTCSGPFGAYLVASALVLADAAQAANADTTPEERAAYRALTSAADDALDERLGAVAATEVVVADLLSDAEEIDDALESVGLGGAGDVIALVSEIVGVAAIAAEGIACILSAGDLSHRAAGRDR